MGAWYGRGSNGWYRYSSDMQAVFIISGVIPETRVQGAMMTIIGRTDRFATQYELNPDSGGEWMFGRFCYWCGGRMIGEYDLGTSLRDVLFQLEETTKGVSDRISDRLYRALPIQDFRLLDTALFGAASLDDQEAVEHENWTKHNILPPVDVFDQWKAFVVEDATTSRVMFARDPYQEISIVALQRGEVADVLEETRRALIELYERTR